MVFEPSCARKSPYQDLGAIKPDVNPTLKNLGVIMESDFKLDKQIHSVIKSRVLFYLLIILKGLYVLSRPTLTTVMVFIGINQASLTHLQMVQNAAGTHAQARSYYTNIGFPSLGFIFELILRF